MTRTERLAVIRHACIRENPEIVELKIGCEVELDWGHTATVVSVHPDGSLYTTWGKSKVPRKHVKVIVGRPIRLADVLLATHATARVVSRWDWKHDDLTEQSDECLAFLATLVQ
jgi:hypothetical protein